jgi:hypothetical protein
MLRTAGENTGAENGSVAWSNSPRNHGTELIRATATSWPAIAGRATDPADP